MYVALFVHRFTGEHVRVHMEHRLAGVFARVEDQAERTVIGLISNGLRDFDHVRQQRWVCLRQFIDVAVMLSWHNAPMQLGIRVDAFDRIN